LGALHTFQVACGLQLFQHVRMVIDLLLLPRIQSSLQAFSSTRPKVPERAKDQEALGRLLGET
jgi:hypothetical protein